MIPMVEVHPEGAHLDVYLPAGVTRLALRALGGDQLSGSVELTHSTVVEIGEGLGPEILLAAGETRVFSFRVERPGQVGAGVRASAEVVETALLNRDGEKLGGGVVAMAELEVGEYLLSLTLPADAPPVTARPVVVGLERPDTGPPAEEVRKYLKLARQSVD
jgi:hypothetical protein